MPLRCGILIHCTKSNISRMDSIQRRATQFFLKSDEKYLARLRKLHLLSLEERRFMADAVFFYKVVNYHVRLTLDSILGFGSLGMLTGDMH